MKVRRLTQVLVVAALAAGGLVLRTSPASAAWVVTSLATPGGNGIARDSAGNLYIASTSARTVKKVAPNLTSTVVAGTGSYGLPTPGAATSSPLRAPRAVAVDGSGNLYIADSSSYCVLKVGTSGTLSVYAGICGSGGASTPGPATSSKMGTPYGLALDSAGNLYIADQSSNKVLKVTSGGVLSVFAGTGASGRPSAGPATSSALSLPFGVATDGSGNVFIADFGNNMVEKVDSSGNLSIFAGTGVSGSDISGAAVSAQLGSPQAVWADGLGNVFISNARSGEVVRVDGDGQLSEVSYFISANGLTGDASQGVLYVLTDVGVQRATPPTAPGPPTGLSATLGNDDTVKVAFTPPASNGGSAIYAYTVVPYSFDDGADLPAQNCYSSPCSVAGLNYGSDYSFKMTALNSVGPSVASASTSRLTFAGLPGPATGVSATAGDGVASVSWTAGVGNGAAITSYTVTADPGGRTCTWTTGPLSCTVTGLTNGTVYRFYVQATNVVGTDNGSSYSNYVTPKSLVSVPGAPKDVLASDSGGVVEVTWSAPDSNGGGEITSYTVTASPGGASHVTTGLSWQFGDPELSFGTDYTFTVTATNVAGTGPSSLESNSASPYSNPMPPTLITAVAGDKQANVSWVPGDANGRAITRYEVTSIPDGKTCEYSVASPETDTCVVSGLTNGTSYTFQVLAYNVAGPSNAAYSDTRTKVGLLPGAPTGVAVQADDRALVISWTAASDGGNPFVSFSVLEPNGHLACSSSGNQRSCSVYNLTNGTTYSYTVVARTIVGDGPASQSASGVPCTTPGTPGSVAAAPGNRQATVSWSAPSDNGGSSVTSYVVTASPGGATCTWTSGPLSCTVKGLTNAHSYSFTVEAVNVAGAGSASSASPSVKPGTAPGKPTKVQAVLRRKGVRITWVAPANNGGNAITSYVVTASPGGATCTWTSGPLRCTITGLKSKTTYTFKVQAENAIGKGQASAVARAKTR